MKQLIVFIAGVLFAVGLAISGMTQPSKVVGFLDFFGNWDPSLAFVMGAAMLPNIVLFRFIMRRGQPLLAPKFHLSKRKEIDWRIIVGGGLFGVGWGLAGYCPGPGITSLASAQAPAIVFVASMAAGMWLFSLMGKFAPSTEKEVVFHGLKK